MNDFDTFWHEAKAALRVALQWFFLAVPMGLLCGFLGTLFHLAVEHATELRAAQPWLLFLLPVAGLLITALYKVTKCEGVGTNNVIRAVQSGEPVSILLVPAIFLGTVLTHLCGGSAGREGAALQMGGSIGWNLGALLRLKDHDRRTATISGMAAFFSALFGTPLAAACFAMMVEDVGLTFTAAFVPAFTSALIAYGCSLAFGIAPTHFALTAPELNVRTALLVILLGVACAAVSRLFCYTLHFMEHIVPKLLPNPWVRVFAGGVLVIGFSYLFGVGRYNGAGMNVITAAVEQGQALPWDFLCKIFLTALTLACGFKGGEVVSTQSARQYKDATDLVCQPSVYGQSQFGGYQEGVSTLRASGRDHGGGSENLAIAAIRETPQLIRRLTPLECERLQGFPDGWTDIPGASDSARYKALGNSLAIPCVEFIMSRIAAAMRAA